jgi:N-acetylglucosamine kinase-like BadF-type ATPase
MNLIVGIDGGGTKTKCLFTDESGKPELELSGGPANFLSIGNDKAAANIISLVKSGLTKLDASFDHILIIMAGISGAGRKHHADMLKESLLKKLPEGFANIFVESDARVALEGALGGEPGAVLIAGTGSVLFGKDKSGQIHRTGGFGRVIGDEGSGYSIGVKTLRTIAGMLDGRMQREDMFGQFTTIFHINSEDDLISLIHNPGFDAASIALFTIRCADDNMKEAKKILDDEADELIKQVKAIKRKMKEHILKLALIGSLVENDNYYSDILKEKIAALNGLELTARLHSPEVGAVIMAQNLLSLKAKSR